MRSRFLVVALLAALVAVSAATAKDHPGKGHRGKAHPGKAHPGKAHPGKGPKSKTGAGCRPAVTVMLAGILATDVDPQDGDSSFVLTVRRSNKHGRAYKQAGGVTIAVNAKTRVRREGATNLGALAPSDRVHVTAKVCKADLKAGGTPAITARKVGAHPASGAKADS